MVAASDIFTLQSWTHPARAVRMINQVPQMRATDLVIVKSWLRNVAEKHGGDPSRNKCYGDVITLGIWPLCMAFKLPFDIRKMDQTHWVPKNGWANIWVCLKIDEHTCRGYPQTAENMMIIHWNWLPYFQTAIEVWSIDFSKFRPSEASNTART